MSITRVNRYVKIRKRMEKNEYNTYLDYGVPYDYRCTSCGYDLTKMAEFITRRSITGCNECHSSFVS